MIGASGVPALGQAVASGLLSAANNIGNALISKNEINWTDVAVDATIGAVCSGIGSVATNKAAAAAKGTIAKGVNRVVSGLNRKDSGSRYWKGAVKRGVTIIADGVKHLNTAQGIASVIGSVSAGFVSVSKTLIKTRRGTM